jgi:hypothetical protein
MGNDTSKSNAQGTDFKKNQAVKKKRRATDDGDESIPIIPHIKHKKISEETQRIVNESIWLANFKRAFRGYLRKKPERSQTGTHLRIQEMSLGCADELGLAKDSRAALIDQLVDEVGLLWYEDALEFLQERGVVGEKDDVNKERAKVNESMGEVFSQMVHDYVLSIGKKLYEKYSRGADPEISDVELDEEKRKKLAEQRAEAIRRAAEQREREAEEWKKEAEMEAQIHEARQRDVAKLRDEQKKIAQHSLL